MARILAASPWGLVLHHCPFVAFQQLCPQIFCLFCLHLLPDTFSGGQNNNANNENSSMIASQCFLQLVGTKLALCIRQLVLPHFCITKHSKTQFVTVSVLFLTHKTAVCFRGQASPTWFQLQVSFHLISLSRSRLRLEARMLLRSIWPTVNSAHISLVKTSHTAKPNISGERKYTPPTLMYYRVASQRQNDDLRT